MDFYTKRKTYYRHFHGTGLDVGPFDKPFLDAAALEHVKVEYVDRHAPADLARVFGEIEGLNPVPPDYVWNVSADGFGFTASKYDFLILSHVLEHVANPLLTLKQAFDKLNDDGVLYVGMPDGRISLDSSRAIVREAYCCEGNINYRVRRVDHIHDEVDFSVRL